jgi:hypothetical protein
LDVLKMPREPHSLAGGFDRLRCDFFDSPD